MNKNESKAKGGIARAAALSPRERKEIAKKAAQKRWENRPPKATHSGDLKIGEIIIPCAVLDGGTRVLSESGINKHLGVTGGKNYRLRSMSNPVHDMGPLPLFIASKALFPFIAKVFKQADLTPIEYQIGNTIAKGYPAEILPKICEIWLTAREKGALQSTQIPKAKRAEILMRGLATVGIVALVDEATGYQDVRDRQALQVILDKYLTDEWAKWTKTFPDDYYKELFRLKGLTYPTMDGGKKPAYVGHWTNDIVYSRLAPGVLKELREKNSRQISGNRKRKHHQHFTRDFGHPILTEHISNITFLMTGSTDWNQFKNMLDRAKPRYGDTIEMDV